IDLKLGSTNLTLVDLSEPYDLKMGNTSKAVGKRKRVVGSHGEDSNKRTRKVPPQESKVGGDASTPLDVDSNLDIPGKS
ncbi:hypothetical protein Tco_0463703, partial [Tanacetum coccineum]